MSSSIKKLVYSDNTVVQIIAKQSLCITSDVLYVLLEYFTDYTTHGKSLERETVAVFTTVHLIVNIFHGLVKSTLLCMAF